MAIEQELPLDYRLNEQVIMVPAGPQGEARLQTTVFRPNGDGPFPLLIINHGKEPGDPRGQARDRFIFMATAFVKRGYAVMVPMRRGFSNSIGAYVDHGCDMRANGYGQAHDIKSTIAYARKQKWIDDHRIVVAGQSYGGLATVAMGTEVIEGVRGLINIAGGLRDDGAGCDWRAELVNAFANYGANNKIASLWMYGFNDSLFGPNLAARMHDAFVRSGGQARLIAFGPFKRDAHGMIASRDGEKVWWPDTERFLQQIGMPTEEVFSIADAPAVPKTDYATVDDIDAVPYLGEAGRAAYREYLSKMTPRAFAVSSNGAWCWAEEGEAPEKRALATCAKSSGQDCKLYSVDDYVVWQGPRMPVVDADEGQLASTATGGAGISEAEADAPR
ncbi:alpha/beta hydrolase family protein [Massilia polaris]|uniref:alpha/beta hydrolase family protein n=1 Tax=Massilia polaris TaxID=2728846 RepID=UPI001E30EC4C|nr:CocE/NonD family hydrolase [Massilia polaris]